MFRFTRFSILLSTAFLSAFSIANARTPQGDNRPRTASISGRVTIAGKPAANAALTAVEAEPKASIPFVAKARTDGEGRYMFSGLPEGRYVVSARLMAFVAAGNADNRMATRLVSLDEGEAREKVDFTLIRGGVLTGKVLDEEGAPLIGKHIRLYALDEQGRKQEYNVFRYEMLETDDRGVYRVYGLPPGRYTISAGGEGSTALRASGLFPLTWHPDTTDEKQAGIVEIREGSEVTDVDIRLGRPIKTYEAAGRVIDKDTGKPVPGIRLLCGSKSTKEEFTRHYSTSAITDVEGNFKLYGLTPGRYQHRIQDNEGESGYTSDAAEFEIANDDLSGVEVKAFLGASLSGFVVMDGAVSGDQVQSITVYPYVTPPSDATGDANGRLSVRYAQPVKVKADGSFVARGLSVGSVSFALWSQSGELRINRVERDGVEIKDAIDVSQGERIAGVRIVADRRLGRIRGQIQIAGGTLPDNWRVNVRALRRRAADESKTGARPRIAAHYSSNGSALVDEKGRFVVERLAFGEYELLVTLTRPTAVGSMEVIGLPGINQRVTVSENDEPPIRITVDPNSINRPNNQERQ